MPDRFELTVQLLRSTIDARRGVARIHRNVLASMGARAYGPITITGSRATAALAGMSPPSASQDVIFIDALTCLNAGVQEGATVTVSRLDAPAASRIVVALPFDAPQADPRAVAVVLLGKVLTEGDRVSLLPQDFARTPDPSSPIGTALLGAIRHLDFALGENWKVLDLWVCQVTPTPVAVVTDATDVVFTREMPSESPTGPRLPRLEELGGIDHQKRLLQEWLTVSFEGNETLERMGFHTPDGILISGPPGSGKTSLVFAVAAHLGAGLTVIYGSHLASWTTSQAAAYLRKTLYPIAAPPPQILLIEEIDSLAPCPEPGSEGASLVPYLLDEIRRCNAKPKVAVIATAQQGSRIDPRLFGSGIFENQLDIPVPRKPERLEILSIHTRSMPLADDVSLSEIADRTAGFVGADLKLLCQKAAAHAVSKAHQSGVPTGKVTHKDFIAALGQVRPRATAGHSVEVGGVTFEDVGDMEEVKTALEEAILWPLRYPETMRRYGLKVPRGVLLFGPPGCGKTFVIRALANEAGAAFFAVRGPELLSKWVGESERAVRDLFAKAEAAAPSILLFDEIDSIAPLRGHSADGSIDRVVGQLLAVLDGLDQLGDVWVVATTNRPDIVDPALLRPGRLERRVLVRPPDQQARLAVLATLTRHLPLTGDTDLDEVAARTEGYSNADLEAVVRKAMVSAIRSAPDNPVVDTKLLLLAVQRTPPSLSLESLVAYEKFAQTG